MAKDKGKVGLGLGLAVIAGLLVWGMTRKKEEAAAAGEAPKQEAEAKEDRAPKKDEKAPAEGLTLPEMQALDATCGGNYRATYEQTFTAEDMFGRGMKYDAAMNVAYNKAAADAEYASGITPRDVVTAVATKPAAGYVGWSKATGYVGAATMEELAALMGYTVDDFYYGTYY